MSRAGVATTRANQAIVRLLFDDVGRPAGHTGHNKDGGVQGSFQPQCMVKAPGRPVEVREEVFLLRQNADLTYEEIAAMRRTPVGTVKTQMRSALQKLRRVLKET